VLRVPPLRERREDVLRIAGGALARLGAPPLSVAAAEALLLHDWPYNVRELEQALAAAAVLADGRETIALEHLPEPVRAGAAAASSVSPAASGAPPSHEVVGAAPRSAGTTGTTPPASQPGGAARHSSDSSDVSTASRERERERILAALAACAGNQTRAAALLGMPLRTLVKRLGQYDLPRPRKR
jgi:DNA-binding NtrC family response regulator